MGASAELTILKAIFNKLNEIKDILEVNKAVNKAVKESNLADFSKEPKAKSASWKKMPVLKNIQFIYNGQTPKAYNLNYEGHQLWFPKSQVSPFNKEDADLVIDMPENFNIPEWLWNAKKKEKNF